MTIRLDAADLRALADTLDAFDRIEREMKVAVIGYDRGALTTPSGEVVNTNRVDTDGKPAGDGPGRYVIEIDQQ
jgi:hypothetical protein